MNKINDFAIKANPWLAAVTLHVVLIDLLLWLFVP